MKKVKLSGGFHNSPEITIALPEKVYQDLKDEKVTLSDRHVLTTSQRRKLSAHFCGIKGCQCGSFVRATITF